MYQCFQELFSVQIMEGQINSKTHLIHWIQEVH